MIDSVLRFVIPALWFAWASYWAVAARNTKKARWRESAGSRAGHLVPFLICTALLSAPGALPAILRGRYAPPERFLPLLGAILVASGLGLAVWARWHLGRNWSSIVTLKEGHALVQTGPYRTVRHPIYTGLFLAVIGTAAAIGEWRGALAVVCALFGILWKIHVEEARLSIVFPEYAQYRKETAALIPLLY